MHKKKYMEPKVELCSFHYDVLTLSRDELEPLDIFGETFNLNDFDY